MGILSRIKSVFTRKEYEAKYVLVRLNEKTGGWEKILELAEPITQDKAANLLGEPGKYMLREYRRGQPGFRNVWNDPLELQFVSPEEYIEELEKMGAKQQKSGTQRQRVYYTAQNPFKILLDTVKQLKEVKESLKELGETLIDLGVVNAIKLPEGKKLEDIIEEYLEEDYKRFEQKAKRYGYVKATASTKNPEIPISGSIPAWAVYVPQLIDRVFEKVERRLEKLGVIELPEEQPPRKQRSKEDLIKIE